MNCSTPGLPVHYHLPEYTQTHVHRVSDAIQPSHPLSSPSPPAPSPSQHQSLFQWVNFYPHSKFHLQNQPNFQAWQRVLELGYWTDFKPLLSERLLIVLLSYFFFFFFTHWKVAVCAYVCACACMLSAVSYSAGPCTVAHQAPLSMGFPRQEYWSELPSPTPGINVRSNKSWRNVKGLELCKWNMEN